MRNPIVRRMQGLTVGLVASLAVWMGAMPAAAQTPAVTSAEHIQAMTPIAWQNLGIELTLALDAEDPAARQHSLQLVNFFATNHHDKIDLTRAVPRLLRIYEFDAEENARIMALTALHAISDENAMIYLRELVRDEASLRVRRLTLAALADFSRRAS